MQEIVQTTEGKQADMDEDEELLANLRPEEPEDVSLAGWCFWEVARPDGSLKKGKFTEKLLLPPLAKIGVELDELTPEQAKYINVDVKGPFKNDAYRY